MDWKAVGWDKECMERHGTDTKCGQCFKEQRNWIGRVMKLSTVTLCFLFLWWLLPDNFMQEREVIVEGMESLRKQEGMRSSQVRDWPS